MKSNVRRRKAAEARACVLERQARGRERYIRALKQKVAASELKADACGRVLAALVRRNEVMFVGREELRQAEAGQVRVRMNENGIWIMISENGRG